MAQVKSIFDLLGTPDDDSWPGCSSLHFLQKFPQRRQPFHRLKDRFRRGGGFGAQLALSNAGLDLLTRMLTLNPDDRVVAKEVLAHQYFREDPKPKAHHLMPTFPSKHPSRAPAAAGD